MKKTNSIQLWFARQTTLLMDPHQNNIALLRALAVTSVFIHHAQHVFGGDFPFFGTFGGEFGPQMFFIISGYLISASCVNHDLREYFLRRVFRILPAYLLYFLGFGIFDGTINWTKVDSYPGGFLVNLLLLQQLFPQSLIRYDVLHVTWTLTVEILWYILAPIIFFAFGGVTKKLVVACIILSSAWSILATMGYLDFIHPEVIAQNKAYSYLFLGNHFISQLCFFILGAYVYCHRDTLKEWNPANAILIGITILILKPYYGLFSPIFVTGIAATFFLIAAIGATTIKNKFIAHVSETSYSIYLCHFPALLLVNALGYKGLSGVCLSVFLTLLLSTLSYIFVEKPGIALGRELASKWMRRTALQP